MNPIYDCSIGALYRLAANWFAEMNEPILAFRHFGVSPLGWRTFGEVALPLIVTSQATAPR